MSNLSLLRRNTPVLEEIAFQGKNFGLALENIFEEMLSKKLKDSEAHDQYAEKIEAIIFEYTNLNINVLMTNGDDDDDSWSEPMMFSPPLNNGNVVLQNTHNDFLYNKLKEKNALEILKIIDDGNITFNHKTGKITGFKNNAIYGTLFLRWKLVQWVDFTAEELTGIMLHEVGHAISTAEYTSNVNTANIILSALLKTTRDDSVETRKIVFKKAADVIGGDTNFDGYEVVTDASVITAVAIDAIYDKRVSLNGTSCYDSVLSEQAPDLYVSRMGYGRQLTEALYKSSETLGNRSLDLTKSKSARLSAAFMEISSAAVIGLMTVAAIAAPIAVAVKGIVAVGSAAIFTKLITGQNEKLNVGQIYDTSRVRLMRLREDAVVYLKNCSLTKKEIDAKLDDIERMDKVIKNYLSTDHKPIRQVICEFLFKKQKDFAAAKDLQRKLEELSANNLFVQSARLRNMSSEGIVDFVKGMFKGKKPKDTLEQKLELVKDNKEFKTKKVELNKAVFGNISNENELLQFVKEYNDLVKRLPEIHKKISNNTIELIEYCVSCVKELGDGAKKLTEAELDEVEKKIFSKSFGQPGSDEYLPVHVNGKGHVYTTTSGGAKLSINVTRASVWYGDLKGSVQITVSASTLAKINQYLEEIILKGIECEKIALKDSYDYDGDDLYYKKSGFDEYLYDQMYEDDWEYTDFVAMTSNLYSVLKDSDRTDILNVNSVVLNGIVAIIA